MPGSVYQAICRMGIFIICAQAVIHFRPKEAYEKYLKLLVGVMVLIQLLLPVGGLFLGKGADGAEALGELWRELEQEMREASGRAAEADALLERMTLEEVRRRLEEQRAGTGEEWAGAEGTGEAPGGFGGIGEIDIGVEPVEPVAIGPGPRAEN